MSDETYFTLKGHHQIGVSPIGYRYQGFIIIWYVIIHTSAKWAIKGPQGPDIMIMETLLFKLSALNNQSELEEEEEGEDLSVSDQTRYNVI